MVKLTHAKCVLFGVEGGEYRATDLNISSEMALLISFYTVATAEYIFELSCSASTIGCR